MAEIKQWFDALPVFTRYWFGASIVVPIAAKIKLISPLHLILTPAIFSQFQIWRPITALFYYPTSFHYLMNLYFLYQYSHRLETGPEFASKPAEYFFLLIFNWICSVVIGYIFGTFVLMDLMVSSVIYVWCQLNKDLIVSFWFGMRMKALYLPWVIFLFNWIANGSLNDLIGIVIGHLYIYIMVQYPAENNIQLIQVPQILYDYFPNIPNQVGGFTYVPQAQSQTQPRSTQRGHQWGRGITLGGT